MERVLGADHPDTLTNQFGLALAYVRADSVVRAIALLKNTHTVCEEVLSSGQPLTVKVCRSLEALERKMNRFSAPSPESSDE